MALPARGALATRYKRNPQPPLIVYPGGTLYFERAGRPEDSTAGEKVITVQTTTGPQTITTFDDVVNLPANCTEGQVSDCVIKGLSLKNELNYNRDTWAEWTKINAVGDSSGIELTGDGVSYPVIRLDTNIKNNTKYGVVVNVLSNTINQILKIGNHYTGSPIAIANAGEIGNKKVIFTSQAIISVNRFQAEMSIPTSGQKIKIRDIRIFELPAGSQIETDFTNLTADQIAQKYPYIAGDSVKSTVSARLTSVGKNLFDKDQFVREVKKYVPEAVETTIDGYPVLSIPVVGAMLNVEFLKSKLINGQYTATCTYRTDVAGSNPRIQYVYTDGSVDSFGSASTSWTTFVKPSNNSKQIARINLSFSALSNFYIRLDNFQIEKSATSTPYETFRQSSIIVPEVGRSVGIAKDEVRVTEGIKTQKVSTDKVFNGGEIWNEYTPTNTRNASIRSFWTTITDIKLTTGQAVSAEGIPYVSNCWDNANAMSISNHAEQNRIYIVIETTKLQTQNAAGLKTWLQANPVALNYQLQSEQVIQLEPVIREQRVLPSRRLT